MTKTKRLRPSARVWAREVAAWRRSGRSVKAYAKRHGLKASTLSWWAWKLRRDGVAVEDETQKVPQKRRRAVHIEPLDAIAARPGPS